MQFKGFQRAELFTLNTAAIPESKFLSSVHFYRPKARTIRNKFSDSLTSQNESTNSKKYKEMFSPSPDNSR